MTAEFAVEFDYPESWRVELDIVVREREREKNRAEGNEEEGEVTL